MTRSALILGILLAACGAPRASEPERIADTLAILASDTPGAFHGTLLSSATREFASFGDLLGDAMSARITYVGETHTNPTHRDLQGRVVRALHARDPRLAIGLEMFVRSDQPALDDWVAGRIDEAEMLRRTDHANRFRPPWALGAQIRQILGFARAKRIPLVALNVPREITRRVAREGLESLSTEERAALPEIDPGGEEHRRTVMAALRRTHEPPPSADWLENAYDAMCVWDAVMADSIVRFLESPEGRERRMVVQVGAGHVRRRLGIPDRVARRTGWRQLVVVPEEIPADATDVDWRALVTGDSRDYLYLTPPPPWR